MKSMLIFLCVLGSLAPAFASQKVRTRPRFRNRGSDGVDISGSGFANGAAFGMFQDDDENIGNERELVRRLLRRYDRRVRPVRDPATVVDVWINPAIYSLIDVNEQQESLTFFQWLPMHWIDEFLQWNPQNYSNITHITIPAKDIWVPDIITFNAVKVEDAVLPFETIQSHIDYTGNVTAVKLQVITARCKFNVLQFPYDVQNCTLQMGSWGIQKHYLRIRNLATEFPTKLFHENSEWNIIDIRSETLNASYSWGFPGSRVREFEEVYYYVVFKRNSMHYIFVMVMPGCIITSLSLLGLFSPFSSNGERQEKVTLGLTNLLTMAVMLQIVADSVPKSADGLPLLEKFIVFELAVSSFGTFLTVVIMFVHQRALSLGWRVPDWLSRVTCTRKFSKQYDSVHSTCNSPLSPRNFTHLELEEVRENVRRCLNALESVKTILIEYKTEREDDKLWHLIFDKLDLVLLIVFLLVNSVVCAKFFAF